MADKKPTEKTKKETETAPSAVKPKRRRAAAATGTGEKKDNKSITGKEKATAKATLKAVETDKKDTGKKKATESEGKKPLCKTKNITGKKNKPAESGDDADNGDIKDDTGIKKDTQLKRTRRRRNADRTVEKVNPYSPAEFSSVEMMSSLKGFTPMGMIFVLMDILKGHEEGLIHVNQLAQALGIGKPSLFAQLDNLESAGLLRTVSSSRAGRHIELLTPNLLRHSALDLFPSGASGNLLSPARGEEEAGGQFTQKRLDFLKGYLRDHGVEVTYVPDEAKLPPDVAQIATFLGKYFKYVQTFYDVMKATLNDFGEFSYSLAHLPSRDITHTLNFCKMLSAADFLSSFNYRRSQRSVVARVNRQPAAINFLSGGWLEHYIRDKVISILTTHPATLSLPYAFMKNPNVTLPGGEPFELDFLLCVGERVFWIEAKTGEYMTYLPKYSRVAKLLGLGKDASMLVSVNALAADDNLTARYGLSCCNLDEFPDVFRINLVREIQQEAVRHAAAHIL